VTNKHYRDILLSKYIWLKEENVSVYENVPDINKLRSYPIDTNIFDKQDKYIIFYFGIISERRGILTAISAVKQLHTKYPHIHLLLIGPIDNAEKSLFQSSLNEEFITHYDWKDISLLPSYLSISDICICPLIKNEQHDSCFANKIYQYSLFGKPLIVSNCTPQEEFVLENNNGLVFRSDDFIDLANKIEYILNNPEISKVYGLNGQIAVENKYNKEKKKEELLNSYRQLSPIHPFLP
jgi:glycosyltransferase involved in cell wall biosynthesis